MTVDFRRSPSKIPPMTTLNNTVETFMFLGSTVSQDLKWASNINTIIIKAQYGHQLRKFITLAWIGHQEQTTTDSQDCRKNHWCRPALHSGLIHVQSQEIDKKHYCRSITPWTQLPTLSSGRRYRSLYQQDTRTVSSHRLSL